MNEWMNEWMNGKSGSFFQIPGEFHKELSAIEANYQPLTQQEYSPGAKVECIVSKWTDTLTTDMCESQNACV